MGMKDHIFLAEGATFEPVTRNHLSLEVTSVMANIEPSFKICSPHVTIHTDMYMVASVSGTALFLYVTNCKYSGPCILRPPAHPVKCGLKLKVVLKWRDLYIENIRVMSLVLKWRKLLNRGVLNRRDPCISILSANY